MSQAHDRPRLGRAITRWVGGCRGMAQAPSPVPVGPDQAIWPGRFPAGLGKAEAFTPLPRFRSLAARSRGPLRFEEAGLEERRSPLVANPGFRREREAPAFPLGRFASNASARSSPPGLSPDAGEPAVELRPSRSVGVEADAPIPPSPPERSGAKASLARRTPCSRSSRRGEPRPPGRRTFGRRQAPAFRPADRFQIRANPDPSAAGHSLDGKPSNP